jgi:hypothetical protein
MPRRPAAFRQSDLTRALKAAVAANLDVATIEIDPATGKIVMTTARVAANVNEKPADKWLANRARAS